jgi:hypothetical protein
MNMNYYGYIRDKFTTEGLFKSMETQQLELPIDIDSTLLDMLYVDLHGLRYMSRLCKNASVDECAAMVYSLYASKWQNEYDLLTEFAYTHNLL